MKHDKIKSFLQENGTPSIKRGHKVFFFFHSMAQQPTTHLMPFVWEGSRNAKFNLQELFWKDCWRPTVTLWMMNHSEHWWLKSSLSSTRDHSLWRPSVTQKVKYHFHQVTSLQWKQVLSCLHQVNLANQKHTQKEMATSTTDCRKILEQMEKGISPESITKADMEKGDSKLCSWWYCFAERWLSSESVANGKNSQYWSWYKKWCL